MLLPELASAGGTMTEKLQLLQQAVQASMTMRRIKEF
jgi:hypothetical protein